MIQDQSGGVEGTTWTCFQREGEGLCACWKQQTRHLTELGHISIDTVACVLPNSTKCCKSPAFQLLCPRYRLSSRRKPQGGLPAPWSLETSWWNRLWTLQPMERSMYLNRKMQFKLNKRFKKKSSLTKRLELNRPSKNFYLATSNLSLHTEWWKHCSTATAFIIKLYEQDFGPMRFLSERKADTNSDLH